ncbi:protein kinase [Amycolatopsis sp. NBC_00355]|uniref:serine/threonine protein kinase n=1 Tax=Amycolatopsis sp. NBC_00355 TaxID=2975957 RepID=UPI002E25B957
MTGTTGGDAYAGVSSRVTFAYRPLPSKFDKRTKAAFDREQAAVRHIPSVLAIDAVETRSDGSQVLRREQCPQSLAELVSRGGPLSAADAVVLGRTLATALAGMHKAGVVHGGVSPHNVLFRASGEPVLADGGLVLRHTFPRDPLHAIEFRAPEAARTEVFDEANDMYGLGAVVHFALTGGSPHPGKLGERQGERVLRVLREPVPAIHREDVPVALATTIGRLLAADPARRLTDAVEVARRLATVGSVPPGFDDFASGPVPPVAGGYGMVPPTSAAPPGVVTPALAVASPPQVPVPTATTSAWAKPGAGPVPHSAQPGAAPSAGPSAASPVPAGDVVLPGAVVAAGSADAAGAARSTGPLPAASNPVVAATPAAPMAPPWAPQVAEATRVPLASFDFRGVNPGNRRSRRKLLVFGGIAVAVAAVGGGLIAVLGSGSVEMAQPAETQPAAPPPSSLVAAPATALELLPPKDASDSVELTWRSSAPMDYAVVVAAEGDQARVVPAGRQLSLTIPVEPGKRYCFLVRAATARGVYESLPKAIRGATCTR